ncbi:MAG: penicillin-insensitive murein endopeptidase, partial [Myxococcota bacterium]
ASDRRISAARGFLRSGETLNSDRMATLQRVINAAGYAELTGEPALDVDSDGGPLTRAGTEWLAEHVGSTTDDPNSPEFWNAVHTFAARDTGPQGDALRTAFGAAVGETVLSETRLEEGPLARSRVGDDDGVDGAPDGADAVPDAPVSGPGLAEEVRPIPDSPLELPTVAADVRDDPRMERLQTIVNEAGYADATGRVALDIDGTGGTLTRAGTEWLAQRVGSPTADPNDSRFWEALNAYTRSPDSGASESFRAAVEVANTWANIPDAPNGVWPTVARDARQSARFSDLQRIINAAGYAEATGEAALQPDGRSGPLSRAGIDWLAEHVGAPSNDPSDPLFWARLTQYAAGATGERSAAVREAVNAAHEGVLANWPFEDTGLSTRGVHTHLPTEDPNIVGYAPMGTGRQYQYGTERTVEMVRSVAAEYRRRTGYTLMVGDISQSGGGQIPGHRSHQHGRNVDLSPAFSDGRTNVHFPRGDVEATWRSPNYDRDATRIMIQLLREANPGIQVLFSDPVLVEEGLTIPFANHDNHIHIQALR